MIFLNKKKSVTKFLMVGLALVHYLNDSQEIGQSRFGA